MKDVYLEIIAGCKFTGDIVEDVCNLFRLRGCEDLLEHSATVARGAEEIARNFGLAGEKGLMAGYLHDTGRVFPSSQYLKTAEAIGVEILPLEREKPVLLHQKLSRDMAKVIFKIADRDILSAIGCHTTLKEKPAKLDMILFIADKLSWEGEESLNVRQQMEKGLERGLEWAVFPFLKHQYNHNAHHLHPMTLKAYRYFRRKLGGSSFGESGAN